MHELVHGAPRPDDGRRHDTEGASPVRVLGSGPNFEARREKAEAQGGAQLKFLKPEDESWRARLHKLHHHRVVVTAIVVMFAILVRLI